MSVLPSRHNPLMPSVAILDGCQIDDHRVEDRQEKHAARVGVAESVDLVDHESDSEIDQALIGPETIVQDLPHEHDLHYPVRQQVQSRKHERSSGQILSGVEDI